ncbi:hypothetical protein Tco_1048967 [Tanacetum coccineum]
MIFSACLSGLVLKFKRSLIMISDQPFRGFHFTVLLLLLLMLVSRILLRRNLLLAILVLKLLLRLKLPRSEKLLLLVLLRAMLLSVLESEDDDDDDACYEISIVTPIRSAAVIPPSGNQSGGSAASAGIMTDADAVVAPSVGASRPRVSSGPAPSFRELSRDAIHRDFFPFSSGPYYATYPEGGIAGNYEFTREE